MGEMARGRDPRKAHPRLGFRTFADDTPRPDLDAPRRFDDPWPEPDYVDPEDLDWEAPPALRAAAPEAAEPQGPRLWPALLICGVAAAALAGAWGYGVLRRGPLPAAMRARPPAAVAPEPDRQLAVQRAPATTAAPPPQQRLETARLAPLATSPRPPPGVAPRPPARTAAPPPAAAPEKPPLSLDQLLTGPPPPPVEPPPAPDAAAPPRAPAAEAQGRSAGTLERQEPPEARAARAPPPLDCSAIRSAAQDIVCRDPGLMAAERRMDRAYAAALAAGASETALRDDQDDWRRIREQAARRSKQAVEDIYHRRIDELEAIARRR